MKILHGTRLQLSESGEIVNFETPTVSTSDASNLSITSEKVDIGSDTNRPSFSDRKMKNTSSNILCASLHLSDDVSTEYPAKDADCASQLGTDEITVHAGGSCLANENISVESHVRKWGSILDLEKSLLDSKDLLTSLGAVRVDGINDQPVQDGLVLSESAFDELPFKCPTSVEVEDILACQVPEETNLCPAFESTGICPRSSMCKLYHPKKKTEKKPLSEQKIVRGRYFDGGLIDAAECSMTTGEKLSAESEDDIVCEEGKCPDYISLDISNDDPTPEMSIL